MPLHRPVPSCLQIKMAPDNSCYTQGTYALGDLCSSKLDNSLRIQPPYRAPAMRDVPCGGQRPSLVAHHTCRVPMQGACDENEDVLGDLSSSTFHTWDHHRAPVLGKSSYFIFRFWKSHFRFLKGESREFSHKKPGGLRFSRVQQNQGFIFFCSFVVEVHHPWLYISSTQI